MKTVQILVVSLLLSVASCFAGEGIVRVVTEIWPPYNYVEDGELTGQSSLIVKACLKRAEISHTFEIYSWPRIYYMALNHENILIYTIFRIPEREKLFKWVRPLGPSDPISLYQLAEGKPLNIKTVEDAKKYLTVMVRDDMSHTFLSGRGFNENQHFVIANDMQVALRLLEFHRVDMILLSEKRIKSHLDKYGMPENKLKKLLLVMSPTPYMAYSTETDDLLVDRLGRAYDELVNEGAIKIAD